MSDNILRLPPISHLTVQFPLHAPQAPTHGASHRPRTIASFQFLPHTGAPAPKKRKGASPAAPLLPRLAAPDHPWPRRTVNYPIHSVDQILPQVLPPEAAALRALSHLIASKQYSAPVLDPARAHLSVYEYQIGTQWVIWDHDTGNVLLTSLWRAAQEGGAPAVDSNGAPKPAPKADIVKLLESTPKALQEGIKRVRGGFLKIQGTWVPYSLCRRLARRFCYHIRYQLVPLFGAAFPGECLEPGADGFGELRYGGVSPKLARAKKARRARRPSELRAPVPTSPHSPHSPMARSHIPAPITILPVPPPMAAPALPAPALIAPALIAPALPTPALIAPALIAPALPPFSALSALPLPHTPRALQSASIQLSPVQWQPPQQHSPAAAAPRPEYTHSAPQQFGWAHASAVPRQPASAEAHMSYAEMVDIVNASHCLQRLSQGTYNKMRIDNLVE